METTSQPNGSNKSKAPKVRSVAYPSYTIASAIDLTKRIDDEFTDVVFTPREDISRNLNMSGGALDRNLSSAVQYGLLELKSKAGYKPTELFKKIDRPLPTENVIELQRECLLNPELYKKVIPEFVDKKLPSDSGLANILDRQFSVKGDAANKAAKVLLRNLEALELIGENNILRLEGGITPVEEVNDEERGINKPDNVPLIPKNSGMVEPQQPAPPQYLPPGPDKKELPVFLKNGREAKILLPSDFDDDDLKRIVKTVQVYLPE